MFEGRLNARRLGTLLSAAAALALIAVAPVAAQDKPAEQAGAWIKLCDKVKLQENSDTVSEVCITHAELISRAGTVIASAGIRRIEGQPKERLMVRIPVDSPIGIAIPAGIEVRVDNEGEPIKLGFTLCYPGSCTAEIEAEPSVIERFKKGKQIAILAINGLRKTVGVGVPLSGFTAAYDGPPADAQAFTKARNEKIAELRTNFLEQLKQQEAAAKAKQGEAPKQ